MNVSKALKRRLYQLERNSRCIQENQDHVNNPEMLRKILNAELSVDRVLKRLSATRPGTFKYEPETRRKHSEHVISLRNRLDELSTRERK